MCGCEPSSGVDDGRAEGAEEKIFGVGESVGRASLAWAGQEAYPTLAG
jgi:hypothetical protein